MNLPFPGARDIVVRTLSTQADYAACVQLQYDTWGAAYTDVVPATILQVAQKVGGVAAGAFAGDGTLLGFVFGLTGVRAGSVVHWSDMLAVRPTHRNRGVGRMLKQFQRDEVRALGVEQMYWTFDPLVARNAHLNLNRLGAAVTEYIIDMYGSETGSELHAFGTDRFVVAWPLTEAAPPPLTVTAAVRAAPLAAVTSTAAVQRIEIPADVAALPVAEAREWRQRTRPLFAALLARGYCVRGFYADAAAARGWYVLEQC